MRQHIDLLAISLLLVGVALVSEIRHSAAIEYNSARLIEFTTRQFQPFLVSPHFPQFCFTRD